jgi:hypothetical protein
VLCPDANLGCRGGKPVTNRLSYGTAWIWEHDWLLHSFQLLHKTALPGF